MYFVLVEGSPLIAAGILTHPSQIMLHERQQKETNMKDITLNFIVLRRLHLPTRIDTQQRARSGYFKTLMPSLPRSYFLQYLYP